MLLVRNPDRDQLRQVIAGLYEGAVSREEVLSWQQACQAEHGWNIGVHEGEGYWYFYSLGLVTLPFPGGHFLRQSDFAEYLVDMDRIPGEPLGAGIVHRRSHEVDLAAVRWPIAILGVDVMHRLPGVRGSFERRPGMVEHCHLAFRNVEYLVVKEYDEQAGQLLLLGSDRSPQTASALMEALAVDDYMFP